MSRKCRYDKCNRRDHESINVKYSPRYALTTIEAIEAQAYEPNEWEVEFMDSISNRKENLTEKQSTVLLEIYSKATGGGIFVKKEYFKR